MTTYVQFDGQTVPTAAYPVPEHRSLRNAWVHPGAGSVIIVNMEAAREIVRNDIRNQRSPRWQAADEAWFKAQESADEEAITVAVAHKNKLRDAPASDLITNATTPEILAAITLDIILAG